MKTKILLLLVLVGFLVSPFKGKAQAANVQDSLALVDLYDSTGGPGWKFSFGWLESPVRNWWGVTLDTSGRVTSLSLSNSGLNGKLPASIGNLTKLVYLYLQNNQISGAIPSTFGNLTKLQYLYLNNNQFTDSIPASFGNLLQLGYLFLNNNQLSGTIPASIYQMGALRKVYLNNNQLSGNIPFYLGGNLAELEYLDLSSNRLSGIIPPSLGSIRYIYYLSFSQNQLSGTIPTELGNLYYLQTLNLDSNQLTGEIPPSLGNLSNLQSLYLTHNQLTDSIPASFGNLANIRTLCLNNNYLNGSIPLSLSKLTNLQNIYLDSNYFTFTSIQPIAQIQQPNIIYSPQDTIMHIFLSNKTLSVSAGGTLSNNTYKWYNGSVLVKTATGDSTYIPSAKGKYSVAVTNAVATSLTLYSDTITLPLYANNQDSLVLVALYNATNGAKWINRTGWLEGPVTNWYGVTLDNFGRVAEIQLDADNLNGTIPANIGTLADLTSLKLDSNLLSGHLPISLGNLVNITNLTLSNNQLSDTMPAVLGNLSKLLYLDLQNNQLSGSIPATIGNLFYLQKLKLSNNRLNNIIPATLSKLTNLSSLSLEHNRFTFYGMDLMVETYGFVTYAPQDTILSLQYTSPQLMALGNGASVNWYDSSKLVATLSQAEAYTVVANGRYSATVTDYNAPALTLYSDTVNVSFAANVTDSLALVDFYNSTDGPKWGVDNWLRGPVINWGSVSLDTMGRVISITFLNSKLKGNLPSTLGNLTNLQTLYLKGSKISGNIPATLGNLKNLRLLDLSQNSLTDSIPSSLGSLTSLQSLNLGYNYLSYNIPSSLGNLSNLTSLILDSNYLSGSIPESLGNLTNLQNLSIYGSWLSGSIPVALGSLSNLQSLSLGSDKLSGSIPAELGNLTNLKNLGLSNDQIGGNIPAALGNLTNLQTLGLVNNQLTGGIPGSFGNLKNLQELFLQNIKISGSLPSELGNLTNLTAVNISNTLLSGSIPPSFSKLINMQSFIFRYNQFSGSIPSFFSNFNELQTLVLSYNNFNDTLPAQLATSSFYYLDFSHNQLTGSVPANLLSPETGYFDLSYNKLNGIFPSFPPQNNGNLYSFNISHNYYTFNGMVPLLTTRASNLMVLGPQDTILPLHFANKTFSVSVDNALSENTYKWYRNGTLVATITGDSTYTPSTYGRYFAEVTNARIYFLTLYSDTVTIADSLILPARPNTEYASYEYTDTAGWTHYYYDNNTPNNLTDDTLLLSLKKNGQDIGAIGDGTFAVKLVATAGAGSNTGVRLTNPLITNTSGYWVMNRYWQVTPTHEPAASVGVRFYYNNQDLKDVNGSYPTHNLTNNKLIFYKAIGGNPDPTTNLAGATKIISILPGTAASDTSWRYHALSDTTQYGEYSVASFSGGGGGGTGNNEALPVTLISFNASLLKNDAQIAWQTSQEVNADSYTVERSLTGTGFTTVGVVEAAGNSSITQSYKFTDYNAALLNTNTLYYRLKITDKDGNFTYSKVIKIDIGGANNSLVVYPNPAQNNATIAFTATATGKYAIELTDMAGKTVKHVEGISVMGANITTIDVVNYAQGTYIVKIEGDYVSKQSLKLVKQ